MKRRKNLKTTFSKRKKIKKTMIKKSLRSRHLFWNSNESNIGFYLEIA